MTDADLVDALARNVVGRPAAACDWRAMLLVRDVVDALLDREVNRRQNKQPPDPASTSPDRRRLERDVAGSKAASESISSRRDLPAPNLPGATAPVVAPGSTTNPYQPPPAA